jgi:D-aminoacyl-tRNA deacylase
VRAVIQRVAWAEVQVEGAVVGRIERGLAVLIGVERGDTPSDAEQLADKILNARVFEDEHGKMNWSVVDVAGQLLLISQFTLLGDLRKGRRPSFSSAMPPGEAQPLFEQACSACRNSGLTVQTGTFRAHMEVSLCNSGPVTLLLDSRRQF